MESSLQRHEQGRDSAGFPLRPFALSLALHVGLLAWWLPQFSSAARQIAPAAVLHGVLLPAPAQSEPVAPRAVPAPGHFIPASGHFVLPVPTIVTAAPQFSTTRRLRSMQTQAFASVAVPPAPTFEQSAVSPSAGGVPVPRDADGKTNVALAPATPAESGPDQAGLRQFRLSLAGEARRFRRYPAAARQAGLTGTTEVRIAVEAGGMARHADLARSSGHEILDQAALDMLRQAAARAVLPESLRGQSFAVLLPVVFEVKE
jgi:protein TonB